MRKVRVLTERKIESKIAKKAIDLGYLTYKFTSPSNRGVPDRIFINKKGGIFFIEFKSLSGKVTPLQRTVFSKLIHRNTPIYLVNDIQRGVDILNNNLNGILDTDFYEPLYEPKNIK
jgi:hypothetical protein